MNYSSHELLNQSLFESLGSLIVIIEIFLCSSEANDLALRLARAHTGHQDVITHDA